MTTRIHPRSLVALAVIVGFAAIAAFVAFADARYVAGGGW